MVVPVFIKEKRSLPLLREGEVASGRVLAQRSIQQRKKNYSEIDYEFRTDNGQVIRNSEKDLTRKVFEDMTVPLFYPLEPSKCVALCASYCKLPDADS